MNNPICPSCKREIDEEVCWCGDYIKNHYPPDCGHNPVPMGCECGYHKPETNKTVSLTEDQLYFVYSKLKDIWEVLGFDYEKDSGQAFAKTAIKIASESADDAIIELLKVYKSNNIEP